MKHKKLYKNVLFVVIMISLLIGASSLSRIIAVKTKDTSSLKRFAIETELLGEEPNSIDVLAIGDSECYTSISPYQIWNETGATTFLASQLGQSSSEAYHLLKMALKNQNPKVVLVEADMFYQYDNLKGSGMMAVKSITDEYFSVFRYHSIWKSAFNETKPKATYKGFKIYDKVVPAGNADTYMQDRGEVREIQTVNHMFADLIFKKIKKSGASIIVFSAPSTMEHSLAKHNSIVKLAKEYDVPYVDMNMDSRAQIDWARDTQDGGGHINISGAERTTALITECLKEYKLRDKRNDSKYASWNEGAKKYLKESNAKIKKIREN